jgi:site-specific DNA-methyltransferase (adenine-specific)
MQKPAVIELMVEQLRIADWNYKTGQVSAEKRERFRNSIKQDSSAGVLAVRELEDGSYEVIDGNHRLEEIIALGWETIHCENFGKISQARAVLISRRRNASWFTDDQRRIDNLMQNIVNPEIPIEEYANYMPDDLQEYKKELGMTEKDTEAQIDKAQELLAKWQVKLGQVWQLGKHKIICGDCTDLKVVEKLMGGEKIIYGIQDPPYGISVVNKTIDGNKCFGSIGGKNIVKANQYTPIINDDKPFDPKYLLSLCENQILWGANYYADKLLPKKGWIVWDKKGKDWDDNFSDCELAWTPFKKVTKIYRYLWMGLVQEGNREKRVHPTQKPVGLYEKIITDYFTNDGIIIDFFLGSGTTLIACENLNRQCRGIEIAPEYIAVTLQRWQDHTGKTPQLLQE